MYLKRVEKQIKSVMISDDANCATAYSKMVDFFMFVDYECKTNHVTIINKLYNTKNSKYTFWELRRRRTFRLKLCGVTECDMLNVSFFISIQIQLPY